MSYIEKEIGERLIETMYKSVKTSIKNTDKLIEENDIAGYNTSFLRGVKHGEINLLKNFIREIRELEEE
ncbi:hypothetical protein KST83_10880 [Fusobacterium nucleatum]|uniref:Uncharacterized protein n=1 Tax=Fusobacterium nucleatum subsp. polymorphum TaxID=76857 RepID=A0A2C6AWA2_FUSNP|nr:hypothetical protein [Fusobacterium polymorphum]PHH96576.1 hypothetical protein CA840_04080 [Fusobacterium polymorphum]